MNMMFTDNFQRVVNLEDGIKFCINSLILLDET